VSIDEDLSKLHLVRPGFGFLDGVPTNEIDKQLFDATRSKFVEMGDFYPIDEDPGTDPVYAVCIVTYGESTKIKIRKPESLKTPDMSIDNIFDMPNNSILITTNSRNPEVLDGNFILKKFKIIRKPKIGTGDRLYRAEITFSDTYHINVFADNEKDALNIAYEIEISNWEHDWPNDPELDRNQRTRHSAWGKKMIEVKEINE
jgi:hypothetical protein